MSAPTIAVIGASTDRSKFGNKCLRAHAAKGYVVYPVNPRAAQIEGLQAYPSVTDIPVARLDRVSIYLPAQACLQMLPDLLQKPIGEVWFNPGADDWEVLEKARALGLPVLVGCSIVNIGVNPHDL